MKSVSTAVGKKNVNRDTEMAERCVFSEVFFQRCFFRGVFFQRGVCRGLFLLRCFC